ncbi:MAG: ribbon-helix-helix protein, CopG family [Candidatus Lokiarchaeota archaeon]|nr:ribbon-helix-helix protein, CopG family [Candidatus Lokiarchaeota archaeon]
MSDQDDKTLITFKIDKDSLEEWDAYCEANSISRSQLIRESVKKFINKKPMEELLDELLFKYIKSTGRSLEKRIIIEFSQIKNFLKEKLDK